MPSFNRVTLIGNLTRDPETKQLPSNTPVTEFGLASSRRYRTQIGEEREDVLFIDCAAFGKQAETIQQYCRKGKPLFVDGRLRYDTWEDKVGVKRSKISVVVENFQFLGARDGDSQPGAETSAREDRAEQKDAPRTHGRQQKLFSNRKRETEPPFTDEKRFTEADIPF